MSNEPTVKRWTAKRKAAVVMDIFKGKTTAAELARQHDLTVSEVEGWIDEAQRSMENGFKARPKDIREQYEFSSSSSRCNDPLVSAHPTQLMLGVPGVPHSRKRSTNHMGCNWGQAGSVSFQRQGSSVSRSSSSPSVGNVSNTNCRYS